MLLAIRICMFVLKCTGCEHTNLFRELSFEHFGDNGVESGECI